MPELPEVETVVRGLSRLIIKKKVDKVSSDFPKSFPNAESDVDNFLVGAKIKSITRRGKAILIDLDTGYSLVTHLKMTGQLVFRSSSEAWGAGHPSDSLVGALPDKSTRVEIQFTDKSKLFFNDQRKFGWMKLLPTSEVSDMPFIKKLGPDAIDRALEDDGFIARLRRRPRSTIKAALLDQSVIAGVGNIYADESLFLAKISPIRLVGEISDRQLIDLHRTLLQVLTTSIEKGGSSSKNYVNAVGKRGNYLDSAYVYKRMNQACRTCSTPIEKIRVAGRGTHFCPICQKEDESC